jgi:hypothetical protein
VKGDLKMAKRAGVRMTKPTLKQLKAGIKPKRITAKQRIARKKNIAIARLAQKMSGRESVPGKKGRMWKNKRTGERIYGTDTYKP